jgi:hypothetical protein
MNYNNATYGKSFLSDLDQMESKGITHPDVAKARELLK